MAQKKRSKKPTTKSSDSDKILTLDQALQIFMDEFPGIEKTRRNPFHGNMYASFDDVMQAVQPALAAVNVGVRFDLRVQGTVQYLELRLFKLDKPGPTHVFDMSELFGKAHGMVLNTDCTPQQFGSELTYFKRYLLATVLNITGIEPDDDGSVASTEAKVDPEMLKTVSLLLRDVNQDMERFNGYLEQTWGIKSVGELNMKQATVVAKHLAVRKETIAKQARLAEREKADA